MQRLRRSKVLSCLLIFMLGIVNSGCIDENIATENESVNETSVFQGYNMTLEDTRTVPHDAQIIDLNACFEKVIIKEAGDYILTGRYNGTIYIDSEDQNVHLFLNNVDITAAQGSAIYAVSSGKLFITSMEETSNSLSDSAKYGYDEEADSCVYSNDSITINGGGILEITGLYKDAIHSKDQIKINSDSEVRVYAKRTGVRGNDGVYISGNTISVESEGDGIKSKNSGKKSKGLIELQCKKISIISGKYCINSASDIWLESTDILLKGVLGEMMALGNIYE